MSGPVRGVLLAVALVLFVIGAALGFDILHGAALDTLFGLTCAGLACYVAAQLPGSW